MQNCNGIPRSKTYRTRLYLIFEQNKGNFIVTAQKAFSHAYRPAVAEEQL